MEQAYSLEYQRIIDAEKAYELYWEGRIKNCRGFICPEPGCNAQVTLSSVKKERLLLKQKPHYKCYGIHKKNCPQDEKEQNVDEVDDGKSKSNNRYINPTLDIITLERKEKIIQETTSNNDEANSIERIKRKHKEDNEKKGKRESEYYTIMPIVSKFIKYQFTGALSKHKILSQGMELTYDSMFKSLDNQECLEISSYNRIYYGDAKIYSVNKRDGDFRIAFINYLTYQGKEYKPSAYISKTIINNSYRNVKWLDELTHLSSSDEFIKVFIYGTVRLNKVGNSEYLNINICRAKLDLIDIRYLND